MPRVATRQSNKPAVLHQTFEIPTQTQTSDEPEAKETRPDFWTYMRALTPEDWKTHIVYLTRERPKTHMNGVVGGYLTKITEPFELDDIKEAYGGYEFSYIMKRGNTAVYNGRFAVEAPPKLDGTRESAGGGENGAGIVQQFVTMLKEELERSRGASGGDQTTAKAVEMLSSASEKAMEMITKQVPETANPATALKELVTVAKDLGIIPGAGAGDAGIVATIRVLKELGLVGQPAVQPAAAVDPMKQLEMMLSIFSKIDEIRAGGGGGGRRDWKAALVDKGLEALPQVLDTFRETRDANVRIAAERRATAEAMGRIPQPRPGGASVMTPRPAAAHPGSTPEPVVTANSGLRTVRLDQTEPAAEPAAPAEAMFETIDRNSAAFTNFLKETIVAMIHRGDHGEQIVDFLDGAKPGFSNTLVEYAPDQLTSYFAMDPILRTAVEHPNWSEVLDEARKYILEADSEEEGEIQPAAAPGGRKPKPN